MTNESLWNEINPFYFGESEKLFGCHHYPQSLNSRSCAVVLCYPIGQEYIRSHRAFYQLAVHLSQVGFHVFRFDYFGCGDSDGDFEEGSLLQWTNDIHTAINEIQERSGVKSICLIGLRMGATLALQAASVSRDVKSVVLWEPVFDGKRYLEELRKLQEQIFGDGPNRLKQDRKRSGLNEEILGFLFTAKLREEMEMIKVDQLKFRSNGKLLVLLNKEHPGWMNDIHHFAQDHPCTEFQLIVDYREWEAGPIRRHPLDTIKYLISWVGAVHS